MSFIIKSRAGLSTEIFELLMNLNSYLYHGPYCMSINDRNDVLALICKINDFFSLDTKWETVERVDTLDDPTSIVFLFEIFRATEDWYYNQEDWSAGKHCALCMYLLFSLFGQCTGYSVRPFLIEDLKSDKMFKCVLSVLMDTPLTKYHITFIDRFDEVKKTLKKY